MKSTSKLSRRTAQRRAGADRRDTNPVVYIIDKPAPEMTYDVRITTGRSSASQAKLHTHDEEATLLSFPGAKLSFSNYGSLSHWLRLQCPTDKVLAITKVQWEAHSFSDIGSAATLYTAKQLVGAIPNLQEVTICVVLEVKVKVIDSNIREWADRLRSLKQGLVVKVRWERAREFKRGLRGGSVRTVDPATARQAKAYTVSRPIPAPSGVGDWQIPKGGLMLQDGKLQDEV